MKLAGAILGCAVLIAGATQADTIKGFDAAGAEKTVDTAALTGCELMFDSSGNAFQVCKMAKIEYAPEGSSRARPGNRTARAKPEPVYVVSK